MIEIYYLTTTNCHSALNNKTGDAGDGFLLRPAVAVSVAGADEDGAISLAALIGDHVADVHCGWHAVHVLPT